MEPETTRKIRNVGIADLFIPFGPHDGMTVPRGEVADVPDVIAVSLLEQPNNWVAADDEGPGGLRAGRRAPDETPRGGAKTAAKGTTAVKDEEE